MRLELLNFLAEKIFIKLNKFTILKFSSFEDMQIK